MPTAYEGTPRHNDTEDAHLQFWFLPENVHIQGGRADGVQGYSEACRHRRCAFAGKKKRSSQCDDLFIMLNRLYSRRAIRSFRLSRILNPLTTTLTGEVRERPEEVNLPEQALPEMPERESGSL